MATRASKRSRSEAGASSPAKRSAKKAGKKKVSEVEIEVLDEEQECITSGMPFVDAETQVEWVKLRNDKATLAGVKISFGGYETTANDVVSATKTVPRAKLESFNRSCMSEFLRIESSFTRCNQMVYYVMCHQVRPSPNFDKTARFFKFGDSVVRFGRREYALISGLKFGPASFNPYVKHELPENSVYEKLFGANPDVTLGELRSCYVNRYYEVGGNAVVANHDDIIKLSKLYLAVSFVLGFDSTKKKIPKWLWILLENDEEWENFPWGSMAFQTLLGSIDGFKKKRKSGPAMVSFSLKGDTLSFSAWIYEALPVLGEQLGCRVEDPVVPRFLRYSYLCLKKGGFPKDEEIKAKTVALLEPTEEEKETTFWKSLELEPSEETFAFRYDQYYSKKKDGRDGDEEDDECDGRGSSGVMSAEIEKQLEECKKQIEELPTKKYIKELLDDMRAKIVEEVADKVTKNLLDHAPPINDPNYDHVLDIAKEYNIAEDASIAFKIPEGAKADATLQAGGSDEGAKEKSVEEKKEEKKSEGRDPKTPVADKV